MSNLSLFPKGIHAIVKNNGSNNLFHRVFNISSGSVEIDSKFPTETAAFMGLNPSKNIQFYRLESLVQLRIFETVS